MKHSSIAVVLVSAMLPCCTMAAPTTAPSCTALRVFAETVEPSGIGQIVFHASWNADVKNASPPAEKHCDYHGSTLGKVVCKHLLTQNTFKASQNDIKWVLECLSPRTVLAPDMRVDSATFEISLGNKTRGSGVDIVYDYEEYASGVSIDLTLTVGAY